MAMRSVVSCTALRRFIEGSNSRSSAASIVRYLSDGKVLGEEERAQEAIYIQKLEREKMEKMKKKAEQDKMEKDKSAGKAEDGAHKS